MAAKVVPHIRLALAAPHFHRQRVAAAAAFELADKPCPLRLHGLGGGLVMQAFGAAFDPGTRIHNALVWGEHQRMPAEGGGSALVGIAGIQIGPVHTDKIRRGIDDLRPLRLEEMINARIRPHIDGVDDQVPDARPAEGRAAAVFDIVCA